MFFEILQTPGNRSLKRKRRTLEMTILRLRFRLQDRPFLDPLVQSAQLLNFRTGVQSLIGGHKIPAPRAMSSPSQGQRPWFVRVAEIGRAHV